MTSNSLLPIVVALAMTAACSRDPSEGLSDAGADLATTTDVQTDTNPGDSEVREVGAPDAAVPTDTANPADMVATDIAPGHWLEVAGSNLSAVFPPQDTVPGNPATVIDAWGGAVYDTDRDRLVLWGGGHADYSGNEVYAFDLNSLQWERLSDPSLDVGGDEASGYYPDGLPRSRHTYDYIVYVPPLGAMCSMGGAALWMSGQINISSVDCFGFETRTWTRYADAPEGTIAGIADYDPIARQVAYVLGPQLRYLATWDVDADSWTTHGDNFTNGGLGIRLTGRVDPVARRFVAVGNGAGYTWELDRSDNFAEVPLTAVSTPPNFDLSNPGLTFDTKLERVVYWGGGDTLWSLDFAQNTWVQHAPAADNSVIPTAPNSNGTYGRFRYAPNLDVYVLVNDATENVFLFRMP